MIYIVKPGDTLYSIAYRFETTVDSIVNVNNISNPNMIYPGQAITLPEDVVGFNYIVQPSDSVYSIANRFGVSVNSIIRANNLKPPFVIFPGQNLFIPGVQAPAPPAGGKIYIVKEGDTLYSIADDFGVGIDEIIKLNNIPRPDLIFPGQRLLIPPVEWTRLT